jgi:hypothetical protein
LSHQSSPPLTGAAAAARRWGRLHLPFNFAVLAICLTYLGWLAPVRLPPAVWLTPIMLRMIMANLLFALAAAADWGALKFGLASRWLTASLFVVVTLVSTGMCIAKLLALQIGRVGP